MTSSAGMIVEGANVTVPSVRLPAVIALVAAARVRPTTFGTVTIDGPDDTTNATDEPGAAAVPAAGVWLMIEPAGTVALGDVRTVPTTRPALVIAVVAADWVMPTTLGTVIWPGAPDDTTSETVLPVTT